MSAAKRAGTNAEIDKAIAAIHATIKRLRLNGTHAEIKQAEDYRDRLLDQRTR